ncbi:uncharacterized protein [Diadema setosum]|uniref:uncharacterized protein n=1 Tax=Diadema setosum TaxID=31175 RepID=UPI003B3BB1EB
MTETENDSVSTSGNSGLSRKERRMQWWSKHQPQNDQAPKESSFKEALKSQESTDALAPSQSGDVKARKQSDKKFYVLFVGQIPYTATTEDITKHFSKAGDLKSVRLATHKDTGKSRGFAYVEFKNNKAYMNGLKMHLSKIQGRPINVEITSPGRGSSTYRKEILKAKNKEMARFRGIKEDASGVTGGALCIPSASQTRGKRQKFSKGTKR